MKNGLRVGLLLLLSSVVWGQTGIPTTSIVDNTPKLITSGGVGDVYYTGGTPYTDSTLPVYTTLRYGSYFKYVIPMRPSLYAIYLQFIEPNQTLVGKRVFSVVVNGQPSLPLDLVSVAGSRTPYTMYVLVLNNFGQITIEFKGIVGNAVVSGIQIYSLEYFGFWGPPPGVAPN